MLSLDFDWMSMCDEDHLPCPDQAFFGMVEEQARHVSGAQHD